MFKKMSSTIVLAIFALQSFSVFATNPSNDPSATATSSSQVISNPSASAISSPIINSNPTAVSGSNSSSSNFGLNMNSIHTDVTANPVANASGGSGGMGGAGGMGGTGGSADSNNVNNVSVNPNVTGTNDQHQGQDQKQGQNQTQQANNTGNSQSTTYVSNQVKQHANVPNLASMFGTPTAPCALPIGGTGVGMGFGFGFNTAYIAVECVKSETAKLAAQFGKQQTANEIFCKMEHAQGTLECEEFNLEIAERRKQIAAIRNAKHVVVQNDVVNKVEVVQNVKASSDVVASVNRTDLKGNWLGMAFDTTSQQWLFVGK